MEKFYHVGYVRLLVQKISEDDLIVIDNTPFSTEFRCKKDSPEGFCVDEVLDDCLAIDQALSVLPENETGYFEIIGGVWGNWHTDYSESFFGEGVGHWELRGEKIHKLTNEEIVEHIKILSVDTETAGLDGKHQINISINPVEVDR
jgi:hypothetical protein